METYMKGQAPPPGLGHRAILQLDCQEHIIGLAISKFVWGIGSHWRSQAGPRGRSERCTLDERGSCLGHQDDLPYRWRGYVEIWSLDDQQPVFVELTQFAYGTLIASLKTRQQLRGARFHAARKGRGKKGRIAAWVEEPMPTESLAVASLPEPRDPNPILDMLFHWNRH